MPWEKVMNNSREKQTLSHSFILFTKDTVLAEEFFLHQTKILQGGCNDCGSCRSCVSIETNSSPDFFLFPIEKYSVESISKIVQECHTRPFEFSTKIFLLRDFDEASAIVQNKLLKCIEEPPENVYFFLTAKVFDKVLPTIRSRCVKFFMKEFEAEDIEEILLKSFSDRKKIRTASVLAMGKISKAYDLAQSDNIFLMLDDVFHVVKNLNFSKNLVDMKVISDKYQNQSAEFLYLLQIVYRDVLMKKTSLDDLVFFFDYIDEYSKIVDGFSTDALIEISSVLSSKIAELDYNVSSIGVMDTSLLKIVEVKNLWH